MGHYTKWISGDKQAEQIERIVSDYRDAAALYPTIIKVFTAFNGKVFNKRLETALQEATGNNRIFANRRSKWLEIYAYSSRTNDMITLSHVEFTQEDKRIDGPALIQAARQRRETLLKDAYEIEKAALQATTTRAYIEQLEKQIEGIVSKIPYQVRHVYGITR